MNKIKIDGDKLLIAALAPAQKEYISTIGMDQTRAKLKCKNVGIKH